MTTSLDTAVIGAGPYGLSVGAHLRARGASARVFGRPLDTWRNAMPAGMQLKSDGFASNLSAPVPGATLENYCRERDLPYHPTDIPVPLATFIDYGLDFQRRFVPELDQRDVVRVARDTGQFRLVFGDGDELIARRVVMATGITHFASLPHRLGNLGPDRVSHSGAHRQFHRFSGKRVAVVGAGSSAVEVAVALADAGAYTSLVARTSQVRFGSPPSTVRRSWVGRLCRPRSGLGPGWRSRASCDAPDLFRYLPRHWRPEIVRRHLGPSSPWRLRDAFESSVDVLLSRSVQSVAMTDDGVRLTLTCTPAEARTSPVTIDVDHVVCATGYRADIRRLTFLDADIRADLRTVADAPVLSHAFESSVQGLHFLGLAAAISFGPLMRFMYGDEFAARRIARALAGAKR